MSAATLYGLTVYARRRVSFGKQDSKYPRCSSAARWSRANSTRACRSSRTTASWSRKSSNWSTSRRQDVLVDDDLIYGFYDALISEGMWTGAVFER